MFVLEHFKIKICSGYAFSEIKKKASLQDVRDKSCGIFCVNNQQEVRILFWLCES